MASAESRIKELNLTLPPTPKPMAKYKPAVQVGNVLYVSGHGPLRSDGSMPKGMVGKDLNVEEAQEAAKLTGLAILATVQNHLGSLDKVVKLVKSLGMVYCTNDFKEQPQVINGYSNLMAEVFGDDAGVGARSAVGMGSLPGNIPVEIEAIFEVET